MGTSFLALDACGAFIHTRPEKVKKKTKKNIKNTKKTLLLKKRRSLLQLFIRLLLLLKHKTQKILKKKSRCKVLPLLQLWWPIPALPQIPLQLQLLLAVNQLSQVSLHLIRMGHHTLWPLFTSAIWPRMSLRPCFLKSSPLRDPFYPSESVET